MNDYLIIIQLEATKLMGAIFYLNENSIDFFLFYNGLDALSDKINTVNDDAHKVEFLYCISNIAAGNDE